MSDFDCCMPRQGGVSDYAGTTNDPVQAPFEPLQLPDVFAVRWWWTKGRGDGVSKARSNDQFDRWLAKVRANAWDEGLLVGQDHYGFDTTNNPYRKAI